MKYCILNGNLYWKDVGGILLNCLLKDEVYKALQEFHQGDNGGNWNWKTTAIKFLEMVSTRQIYLQISTRK